MVDQVGSTLGPPLVVASSYFSVQWLTNPSVWKTPVDQNEDILFEKQVLGRLEVNNDDVIKPKIQIKNSESNFVSDTFSDKVGRYMKEHNVF